MKSWKQIHKDFKNAKETWDAKNFGELNFENWIEFTYPNFPQVAESTLPVSASEQKPDGFILNNTFFTNNNEDATKFLFEINLKTPPTPVYFSPQPNKVSESDEETWSKIKELHDDYGYFQGDNWKMLKRIFKESKH